MADDFAVLGSLLASSAILTAVFIAVSGLPLFVRIAVIVLTLLFVTSALPALIFSLAMRGSMRGLRGGPAFVPRSAINQWPLLLWNAIVPDPWPPWKLARPRLPRPRKTTRSGSGSSLFLLLVPIPIMMKLHVDRNGPNRSSVAPFRRSRLLHRVA